MSTTRPECDITQTQTIIDLLSVPADQRDEVWNQKFLIDVQTASFACTDPQIVKGPDGFPYFGLHIPEPGKPFTSYCIKNMAEDFLLDNGYGVVINPKENAADWVFSYGDIINLQINKMFYSPVENVLIEPEVTISKNEHVLIAQPSESYLPAKARIVLRKYLQYFGVSQPKIMLISRTIDGKIVQELAINIFKEEVGHPEKLGDFMRQLGWFLPRHYILMLVPKNSELATHFEDL
ncbi:MAG: hypothetical protein WAT91_07135 [Saprospiraceae bacterium]